MPANRKYGTRNMRFGWFDTTDDAEVSRALLDSVVGLGAEGRDDHPHRPPRLHGPRSRRASWWRGSTSWATMSVIYNHPYYASHLERYGLVKDVDYVEFHATAPEGVGLPERW